MSTTNQLPEPDHELAELAAMRKAKKITDYKEFIAYYGKQAAYWEQRLKELDMTETNQLPPSEREAFEAFAQNCPMGKYSIARRGDGYDSSHTQLMWDAWQARAQVQGELEPYDAGLLNDFGGGNVEWWQDYIRAELGRAHDFYQSQITTPQSAQATQAEVTDEQKDFDDWWDKEKPNTTDAYSLSWYSWQARAQVQGEVCPTCGETEPYTGSCGTSNNDTKALCKQPPQATQAEMTDGIQPEDFTVDVVVKSMGGFAQINTKGVRVTHKPTGISVTCDAARSQHANRQQAFEKLSAILAQQPATGEPVKSFAELREKHRPGIDAERAKLDATKKEPS